LNIFTVNIKQNRLFFWLVMNSFKNKVVLITGAASGIGAECATQFSARGAIVVAADIDCEKAKAHLASIPNSHPQSIAMQLDITLATSWQIAMAEIKQQLGKLNVLVNCAGMSLPGDIESTDMALWQKTISLNLDGTFMANKFAIGLMKQNDDANSIVNISSALSLRPQAFVTAYSASKAAVDALTKCVALHCGQQGLNIRCNSVHPGAIHTPMLESYLDMMQGDGSREDAQAAFDANHPIGHCGQPEDIAKAAIYLASDDAKFVTGALLAVDGGQCIA
jgi:NAD(P)-dependent dehydrogenase (short-subunit alcohol dehydrogenase family)